MGETSISQAMSPVDHVLSRMEVDFDFYLAVHDDPRRALARSGLSSDEVDAFVHGGQALWRLVASHTARVRFDKPDGGLPPPPPPFVVHYSTPIDFEPWRGDREADLAVLRANPTVRTAVETVLRARSSKARARSIATLMEHIG